MSLAFGKYTRSYATEAALMKKLAKHGFDKRRPIICRTPEGRWTAIFGFHLSGLADEGGYVGVFADHGFLTIN